MISARVAIATSTGDEVDMHFGQCSTFYVYDLAGEDKAGHRSLNAHDQNPTHPAQRDVADDSAKEQPPFSFVETRSVHKCCTGGHHEPGKFEEIADTLSDCSIILCEQIGPGASRAMQAYGFVLFEVEAPVEGALKALSRKLYMI